MYQLLIVLCISWISVINGAPQWNKYQRYLDHPSVARFREYVRIDTSKAENLNLAVEFLVRQATQIGIPYVIYQPAGKPIFVATLQGSDPSLPSIMLNHHMDVVPVDAPAWLYPPFAAYMDDNGDIYGRGTQDTKDVGIQYLEAIRRLKKDNVTLLRTLHVTVMPDEETGGFEGMRAFVKTKEFKSLNIGFALDEGLTSPDDSLFATFVDRRPWQMRLVVYGIGGHGSGIPDNSAMENAYRIINAVMKYRDQQKAIMRTKDSTDLSGYNSININNIEGGLVVNIIPSKMMLEIDMRLSPDANPVKMEALINSWVREGGNKTELTFLRHETESGVTPVDDSNPYWVTMRNTLNGMGFKVKPIVCPATSDMLVMRNHDYPAIGFSVKTNMMSRIHTENEYHHVETFLRGIDIYTELIKNLGNIPCENTASLNVYASNENVEIIV